MAAVEGEKIMETSGRFTEAEMQDFLHTLAERGQVILQGVQDFRMLRQAIERAAQNAGVAVEWDPNSSVDFREMLGVISWSALHWCVAIGALGLMLGGFTERPGTWSAVGCGVGAIAGGIHGYQAVQSGWRIRGYSDERGAVFVKVKLLPRAASA